MVKDRFGNEVKVGDLVEIDLSQRYVIGRVVTIKSGGIAIASVNKGQGNVTPDIVIVACEFLASPPQNTLIKSLKDPEKGPKLVQ